MRVRSTPGPDQNHPVRRGGGNRLTADGRQLRHVRVSPDAVRTALQAVGVAAWFADDMAKLHGMFAGGYEEVVTHDVRAVTGARLVRSRTSPPTLVAPSPGSTAAAQPRPRRRHHLPSITSNAAAVPVRRSSSCRR